MDVLTQALRSTANLDMRQNPSLVANALRPGDEKARMLLAAAAESGAGLVISPAEIDIEARTAQPTSPPPADTLIALFEQTREKADAAGVNGPLFADTLAYPPAIDATRCDRSLDVLRALAAEPAGFIPLVAVGNIGHGAPTPIRPALQRLYAAAALGAGARALILPVEDRGLVAAITGLAPPLASETVLAQMTATHTAELDWLRRVSHAAERGRPLPSPPVTADLSTQAAWALFTNN